MKRIAILALMLTIPFILSCGEDHGSSPQAFKYEPPQTPSDFEAAGGTYEVTLTWSYPQELIPGIREFRIYYYYDLYDMVEFVDTTTAMSFVDSDLIPNVTYCYKISAVDTTGLEGYRSGHECAKTAATLD